MEEAAAAAQGALANLFSKLLLDLDSPRLPESKGKRKGCRKACVSPSFILAPSVRSRLWSAGFLQAGHVSLGETLALRSIAQFRRKTILSHACLRRQRGPMCQGPPPCSARSGAVGKGEAATGDQSRCLGDAVSKILLQVLALLFHDI